MQHFAYKNRDKRGLSCPDFVQLQLNYLDWDSENIQSRKCYEIARKHGKDIEVMGFRILKNG